MTHPARRPPLSACRTGEGGVLACGGPGSKKRPAISAKSLARPAVFVYTVYRYRRGRRTAARNKRKGAIPMDMNKRPDDMIRITTPELAQAFIDEQVAAIRSQVGDKKVLLALSGGVDSSVVAALLIKAIGKQLVCVHVNHGLLRKGEPEQVVQVFRHQMGRQPRLCGRRRPLPGQAGRGGGRSRSAAQDHRRRVHSVCSREEARKQEDIKFLAQGTILPGHPRERRRQGPPQRRRPAGRSAV